MKNANPAATTDMVDRSKHTTRLLPPAYFFLSLIAMLLLHLLWPLKTLIGPPTSYLGVIAIASGFAIVLIAARDFERRDTTIKPFQESAVLIEVGLYRISRNPMYLGMLMALLGVAVLLGSLSPLLPIPILVYALTTRFIHVEESMLLEKFGENYAAYCRKVRRWL